MHCSTHIVTSTSCTGRSVLPYCQTHETADKHVTTLISVVFTIASINMPIIFNKLHPNIRVCTPCITWRDSDGTFSIPNSLLLFCCRNNIRNTLCSIHSGPRILKEYDTKTTEIITCTLTTVWLNLLPSISQGHALIPCYAHHVSELIREKTEPI